MTSRFLAVLAALAAMTAPALAQAAKESAKPIFVVQAQPISKILDDVKAAVKAVAGDEPAKQFDESLQEALGEKGFTGVDLLRPIAGYMSLKGNIMTPEDIAGMVMVPVTNEKDFVDFLERLKAEVDPVKGKAGLYDITPPNGGDGPFKIRMRVVERTAYFGINLPDDELAADKVAKAADLINPAERGLIAMTSHLNRVPKEYIDQQKQQFEMIGGILAGTPLPEKAKAAIEKLLKISTDLNIQYYTEGDVTVSRILFDRATNEVVYETSMKAKKGTPLEKLFADRKPTTNRFAGIVPKDASAGVVAQAPLFLKDFNETAADGVEALADYLRDNNPPPKEYAALFDAAMEGAARTIKSGELDIAAALSAPTKDGNFGVVAAISFDDPSKVEKELRVLHKNAPEGVQALMKLDVAKANGVSIHEAKVGAFLPPEPKKVFGENASLALAFAPKGVYLAFGPNAVEAISAALAAKPTEARAFDLTWNPSKVQKFVAAIDANAGQTFTKHLGTENKTISAAFMEVVGGTELNVRMGLNLKGIPQWLMTSVRSAQEFRGAVPPELQKN